ncbi:hypothetical protein [Bacillus benzoevorans]|uniref:DUF2802 domain-containing protein n=1 Tax=Bacillus benzoevorans TaxID=1456 RepID=A0A7X0LUF9_9BACI|nr:hypothetical protein [Bacillus benzoevorans]MBB6444926.1 hypothetical protein [Bacillus benzoevorans]
MEKILIILIIIAIGLWIISFFLKDPYKQLREDMDQLFMQQLEEIYHIKKKLKVLEEELLINDIDFTLPLSQVRPLTAEKSSVHEIIKNQVWSLAQQGIPLNQIAEQASLSVHETEAILAEFNEKSQ